MTDLILPTTIDVARNRFRYVDSTGVSRSPYGGVTRTAAMLGDRIAASIEIAMAGGLTASSLTDRAALISFIGRLQGQQGRVYLWDHAGAPRGSFPASELFSNNDFSNGLTNWTAQGNLTQSVVDRVYRLNRSANDGTTGGTVGGLQALTLTQFVPYVYRVFVNLDGGLTSSQIYRVACADSGTANGVFANVFPGGFATNAGMRYAVIVPGLTGGYSLGVFAATTTDNSGDFQSVHYLSAARCALADTNPNLLLQSDDFTTTWTNANSTDSANAAVAPDGTTTADSIIEDATPSVTHYVTQPATGFGANTDYSFTCCLKANTRSWAWLSMVESTGSTIALCYFNLGTGAIGTVSVGANWTHARAYIVSLGNGWYRCYLIGRKTSAGTTITCRMGLATADTVGVYSGDGASNIFAWRAGLTPSGGLQSLASCGAGLPFLPAKTTTTANTTGTSPASNAMWLKGLPVSTNGLLLPGDWVEIQTSRGSEIKLVAASVNSDAAGSGLLVFSPRLRGTVSDCAPVIICRPMGKFVYSGNNPEWSNDPGVFSAASFDFEEST